MNKDDINLKQDNDGIIWGYNKKNGEKVGRIYTMADMMVDYEKRKAEQEKGKKDTKQNSEK